MQHRRLGTKLVAKQRVTNVRALGGVAALALALALTLALVSVITGGDGDRPPHPAPGEIPGNQTLIDASRSGIRADGRTNDAGALRSTLASLGIGRFEVVLPPGEVILDLDNPLVVPSRVTLRGSGREHTTIRVRAGGPSHASSMIVLEGEEPGLADMTLRRDSGASVVMVTIRPSKGASIRGVQLDCATTRYRGVCHGMQLAGAAGATIESVRLEQNRFVDSEYGLFQASDIKGEVRDVLVSGCAFDGNRASDLEFNSPQSRMLDIRVVGSHFSNNKSTTESAGWAVGFAKVQGAVVKGNEFSGYGMSAIHIEDDSSNIELLSNRFSNVGTRSLDYQSDVIILSGSRDIRILQNRFEHPTGVSIESVMVWVGHGGSKRPPVDVLIEGNVDVAGGGRRLVGDNGATGIVLRNNGTEG